MGLNGVPGQLLLRFAPFLLQWYSLLKCKNDKIGSVDGEIWQIGVKKWGARRGLPGMCPQIRHVPPKWVCFSDFLSGMCPKLGNIKHKCSGNIFMPSLKLTNLGAQTRGTFEKYAHSGGSCPPLIYTAYKPYIYKHTTVPYNTVNRRNTWDLLWINNKIMYSRKYKLCVCRIYTCMVLATSANTYLAKD
jgi:hypothetical protein